MKIKLNLVYFSLVTFNLLFAFNTIAHAEEDLTRNKEQIIDLVKKARDFINTNGKEKALAEFNKKTGIFSKDQNYIFAVAYNGTFLATINYPNLIGTNQINFKDSSGVFVVQEEIEKAKSGGGWLKDRLKKNPYSGKFECKASYIHPMAGDYFIGSGYYYPADKQGNCRA